MLGITGQRVIEIAREKGLGSQGATSRRWQFDSEDVRQIAARSRKATLPAELGDFYHELGVKRVINAAGTLTRLGGTPMDDDVLEAMRQAAQWSVRIEELQEAAGNYLAAVTGAEAGYVTAGAAAGLLVGTAACITGLDIHKMNLLPDTDEDSQRGRRPAHPPQCLRPRPAHGRGQADRGRTHRPPHRRLYGTLAHRDRHQRAHGGRALGRNARRRRGEPGRYRGRGAQSTTCP